MNKYINKMQVTYVDLCPTDNKDRWDLFIGLTSGKFERAHGTREQMVDIMRRLNTPDSEKYGRLVKISGE